MICGYISAVVGKKIEFITSVLWQLKICSSLNRLVLYYDGEVWGVIIGLRWGDKEHAKCRAGPGPQKTLHTDPPCEKLPVPRTRCVRLGGNNSPGPLTSSFGLLRFMTPLLCHTAAVSAASLCPDWIRGKRMREERQGNQLGWGGKQVWYEMEQVFSVETVEMTSFPTTTSLRPHLTLPSHQTKAHTVGNQWFDNHVELLVGFHFMYYFYIMTDRNENRASEVLFLFKALFFQIWKINIPNCLLNLFWIVIKSLHT